MNQNENSDNTKPSHKDDIEEVRYTPVSHLRKESIVLVVVPIVMFLAFTLTMHLVAARMAHVSYSSEMDSKEDALRITAQNINASLNAQEKNITTMHKDITRAGVEERLKIYIKNTLHSSVFGDGTVVNVSEIERASDGSDEDYDLFFAASKDQSFEGKKFSSQQLYDKFHFPFDKELDDLKGKGYSSGTYSRVISGRRQKFIYYSCYFAEFDWIVRICKKVPTIKEYTREYMLTMLPPVMLASFIIVLVVAIVIHIMLKRIHRHDYITYRSRNQSLQELVDEDALTHACSRRKGDALLQEEFERLRILDRYDTAVMMIDMDFFKGINDQYGHDAGDHVLKEMVKAIRSASRTADDIIRWGGDEFLGIFRGMTDEKLPVMQQRISDAISSIEIYSGGRKIEVSASIGASYFRKDDLSCYDVVKRADRLLYTDKKETHGNEVYADGQFGLYQR
jgi:diguanylate cyclase (GGDEF)-like protein